MRAHGFPTDVASHPAPRRGWMWCCPLAWLGACGAIAPQAFAQPVTSRLTYQGRLDSGGSPASGPYDMRFALYNAAVGGLIQGTTLCVDNVSIAADGTFTVGLDFGDVFDGTERYLQVDVRADTGLTCSTASGFTSLPRQRLTATPYAAHALVAGTSLKPWTPIGASGARFDGTFVGINASTPVTTNGVFQVSRSGGGAGGFGGMFVTTDHATGRPFYGYNNTPNFVLAYHYLDGSDNSWRLFVGSTTALTATSTGFVGLGTTTPSERLHVAGNVLVTGNQTVNGNITTGGTITVPTTSRYESVGTGSLIPYSNTFNYTMVEGNITIQDGSFGTFFADLRLPQGAILREATAYFFDSSPARDINFSLRHQSHAGTGATATTTLWSYLTGIQAGGLQSHLIDFPDEVIDNQNFSYILHVEWRDDPANSIGVRRVVFRYTVTSPMP